MDVKVMVRWRVVERFDENRQTTRVVRLGKNDISFESPQV